ncbi:DUF6884 domain-containing protein [Halorubrum sp. AJ67]|uniref:DUF6884 domain-containing protein n=1 Tax=Halorubrum sp. AJ67 TaxID=1173487 RepID=UPI0003DC37AC|nr:DUF6884 domain-containing protein [Halorubrum sp. AJ67]CDK38051.1 hypothetical protein BN903_251 [Halorubrum sp. AJ67]
MSDQTVVGITACSKSKSVDDDFQGKIEAQHLYDSWLFDSRRDALKANCDEWAIFSGKFGYVEPDEKLPWYDQQISELPEDEQWELAEEVADNVTHTDKVLILMGRDYAEKLKDALDASVTIWDPLEGVQLFDQRGKLKELADGTDPTGQTTFAELDNE